MNDGGPPGRFDASAAMYVHPKMFRYRLRHLTQVSGTDLSDPQQRFTAMLQVRVISLVIRRSNR